MSTATFHYADVAADLRTRAAKLFAIAGLLEEFILPEDSKPKEPAAPVAAKRPYKRRSVSTEPASSTPTTEPAAKEGVGAFGEDGRFHRLTQVRSMRKLDTPGPNVALPTVADLVRRAAREPEPRTTIGLIDRVAELAQYNVKRETVSTTISQQLKNSQLVRKGEDAAGAPFIRPADEVARKGAQHA